MWKVHLIKYQYSGSESVLTYIYTLNSLVIVFNEALK